MGHTKKENIKLGGVWRWVWEEEMGSGNECDQNTLYACLKFSVYFFQVVKFEYKAAFRMDEASMGVVFYFISNAIIFFS